MRAHAPKTCRARYRSRLCIRALEANGPRGGRPEFRSLAGSRAGREGNGSGREARRQLLPLRQRTLVPVHRDPAGPQQLEQRRDAHRADREADVRSDPGGRQSGCVRRSKEDRRHLCQLHGRGGDRGEGPRSAPAQARRHRPDLRQEAARTASRDHAAGRRGRPEQHLPLYGQRVRALGGARPRRSRTLLAVPAAGRPGHARPRLLSEHLAQDGGGAREVPVVRHQLAPARRSARSTRRGAPHRRYGGAHRRSSLDGGADGKRKGRKQPLEAKRLHDQGAGSGLGCVFLGRGSRAGAAPGIRRLAAQRNQRHRRDRSRPAPDHLEGIPDVPCAHARRRFPPARVRGRELRLPRQDPHRRAQPARPLEARGHGDRCVDGGGRGEALRRALLSAFGKGAGPGHGPQRV